MTSSITLSRALRRASSYYARHIASILPSYLLLMSLPILMQTYVFETYLTIHLGRPGYENNNLDAIVGTINPSDTHYFAWAFARMFGDLLTPFAVAWLIVAIKHLIRSGKPEPTKCLELLGHKWLTIAQYGLMMHIVWYVWNEIIQNIGNLNVSDRFGYLIVFAFTITYAILNFGYVAGLVVVTLDRIDPIRAILFGMWFALRNTLGSIRRLIILTAIAVVGVLLYAVAVEIPQIVVCFICILAFTIFYSWVYFGLVLFVLHRIASKDVDLPKWPRFRLLRLGGALR